MQVLFESLLTLYSVCVLLHAAEYVLLYFFFFNITPLHCTFLLAAVPLSAWQVRCCGWFVIAAVLWCVPGRLRVCAWLHVTVPRALLRGLLLRRRQHDCVSTRYVQSGRRHDVHALCCWDCKQQKRCR